MRILLAITIALLPVLAPASASACQFDMDCAAGSKCVIPSGSRDGACVGGNFPGNETDRRPAQAPPDPNETYGKTCSSDSVCGPRSGCVKSGGSIQGTCLPGR